VEDESFSIDEAEDNLDLEDASFRSVGDEPSSRLRYGALPQNKEGWVGYLSPSRVNAPLAALRSRTRVYMRLADRRLYLYKNDDPNLIKEPLKVIDLKKATVAPGRKECEFLLATPSKPKPMSFKVESLHQREDWIEKMMVASKVNLEDHYNMGRRLGKGAFGEVRLAEDKETNEKFAIKVLKKQGRSSRQKALLEREVKALTSVSHENIVRTLDIFDQSGELCIVSEYVDGGELGHLMDDLDETNVVPEDVARNLTMQLLQGLLHLHQHGIVHRDIKPENILCVGGTWPPKLKLTDFGLSNFLGEDESAVLKSVVGSPVFIAPEMVMRKGYTTAVDIWGVGVVVHQLLTGVVPFNVNDFDDYREFLRTGPKFRERRWEMISEDAQSFVRSLLQVHPQKRLTAASALQHRWLGANKDKVPVFDRHCRPSRRLMMSRRMDGTLSRKSTVIEIPKGLRPTLPSLSSIRQSSVLALVGSEKGSTPVSSARAKAVLRKWVLAAISINAMKEACSRAHERDKAPEGDRDMKNLNQWIDRLAGKHKEREREREREQQRAKSGERVPASPRQPKE